VIARAVALCASLWLSAAVAYAQSSAVTSEVLREGNTAAMAGDWQRVAQLVTPLLRHDLSPPDLAEAHRLAGLAAFFQLRSADAEAHFLAYLRIDLDGRLDPALYPPDVVAFFNDLASRHAAELRARRAPPSGRSWLYTLIPPVGQFQNGERTKAYVIGGVLGAMLITNLVTYAYLRAWCDHTDGPGGGGLTCTDGPDGRDGTHAAQRIRPFNIASGIGFWVVYAYGVYDGIRGYRQISLQSGLQPYITVAPDGNSAGITLGVIGRF
jgi:hypothetical protein